MIAYDRFALNRAVCPNLDIAEFFALASRLGIHKVELRNDLRKGIIEPYSPEAIRSLAKQHNVRIITINRFPEFNVASQPPQLPAELAEMMKLAIAIECDAIILVPSMLRSDTRNHEQVFQDTVKTLKNLRPHFEAAGLLAYIEALGFPNCCIRSVLDAMNMIREAGGTCYKVTYDTFHHYLGTDTREAIEKSLDPSYLGLVHISGVTLDAKPEQYNDTHRTMVGPDDRIANVRQLALLEKIGYRGNIAFEPFAQEVHQLDARGAEEAIRQSIKFVQDMTNAALGETAGTAS